MYICWQLDGTKGFELYKLKTKRVIRSRSVLFYEEGLYNNNIDKMEYNNFFPSADEMSYPETNEDIITCGKEPCA